MKELTTSRFMSLIIILDLNEGETTQKEVNSNFLCLGVVKLHNNKLSNLIVMRSLTTAPCQETIQIVNTKQYIS